MPATQFNKGISVIPKGEMEGRPLYTKGARVRRLGLPTNPDGTIALSGSALSFEGSYGGSDWFTINDYIGNPLLVSTKVYQNVIPGNGLKTAPASLPVQQSYLFEGVQMLRPKSNQVEAEDRSIEIYYELG